MKRFLLLMITGMMLITISGCVLSLPEPDIPEASVLVDIEGRPIKGLAEQNRVSVPLEEISPYFIQAIIAVEDKNFYQHHGLDLGGLLRATWSNLKSRKIVAGGSTISQQTAKNIYLTNERTMVRKVKELYYAFLLEKRYSKDEILDMYCNTIYFGQGAYGVEVAARTYFACSASDLDLAQAALLAGLPQWPSKYDPYVNPEYAKKRQEIVLHRMHDEGKISEEEMLAALDEKLEYKKGAFIDSVAPHFVAMIRDELRASYGDAQVYQGGLEISTTLDLDMQKAAGQAVEKILQDRDPELQAALIALDVPTGQIRAMVGGRDYSQSKLNRVFSYRQPGSTFKPFVYSLALEDGLTAADMYECKETKYRLANGDVYQPTDYGKKPYHGRPFTLKEAIVISDNVVAVRLLHDLGVEETVARLHAFGFAKIQPVLSLVLGSNEVRPLDLAGGFQAIANQGTYYKPSYLLEVKDREGRSLEKHKSSPGRQVLDAGIAAIITDMMQGVLEPGGTASHLKQKVGRPAAVKTGTTDEYRDAWFVGYTPDLVCVVWVGYDRQRNVNLSGGAIAGPIWADFMYHASSKLPVRDFSVPEGMEKMSICLDSGLIASEACPRTMPMLFKEGTAPADVCYEHSPTLNWWRW